MYCVIDLAETAGRYDLENIFNFVRAISMIVFLACCSSALSGQWSKNQFTIWIQDLLFDCSRFSLQLYLFNGYLLTIFRILVCSVLKVSIPIIIVLIIWLGNIAVTLMICKWGVPKVPFLCVCCGIERRKCYENSECSFKNI